MNHAIEIVFTFCVRFKRYKKNRIKKINFHHKNTAATKWIRMWVRENGNRTDGRMVGQTDKRKKVNEKTLCAIAIGLFMPASIISISLCRTNIHWTLTNRCMNWCKQHIQHTLAQMDWFNGFWKTREELQGMQRYVYHMSHFTLMHFVKWYMCMCLFDRLNTRLLCSFAFQYRYILVVASVYIIFNLGRTKCARSSKNLTLVY